MREDRKDWLRQRAYAIWESEGRPDGREHAHWAQAERELAADHMPEEQPALAAATAETSPVKKPRKRAATPSASSTARSKSKATELRPSS